MEVCDEIVPWFSKVGCVAMECTSSTIYHTVNREPEDREPQRNHLRTTMSAALSSSSVLDERKPIVVRMEDVVRENASIANLVEIALAACSQVE